ncbi:MULTISPECIES: acetyl-CoA carboxylase biotin carboxylase subunit [Candidatus Ichthyocystis]|uniref:Biotin carboxylase n=1 Tax=Candidatus Ichthyocystis hellenicum TaxID=1561003 RepID=A0A0S4M7E3_9BURK|nr:MULTISPECIES: acetyl-CoA carboxylase biotin carboxylase subunit [Ichthyocystis]CUT17316.1 acetyl-CoA carboxylase biotin carboxylase subunit [Candidatus Ichthyocystis hellenicum]
MFRKVLIANRGEIALRILRACHSLGIRTVAVYSLADSDANYVKMADEAVCIGPVSPAESYLNIPSIISAAEVTDADAIHPGYGFLSENADFADKVEKSGFVFIGPTSEVICLMGDKVSAKRAMTEAGIVCVPGYDQVLPNDRKEVEEIAKKIGYPIIVKASGGGGGRGMRVVAEEGVLWTSVLATREEAERGFRNGDLYIERFLDNPRHIEFQVLADKVGNVVHLGERDCSLQRRHQKILEESPALFISDDFRNRMGEVCVNACRSIGYVGAGTFEFLLHGEDCFFIEMNTRIQVEHPVTEMVTGVDLIREQILIAAGHEISFNQSDVVIRGHAIECRINAEDPVTWMPFPGLISVYNVPGGPGVRLDSHVYHGYKVSPYYDSLVGKLIVHGSDRAQAIARMKVALSELVIGEIKTNIPLHFDLLSDPDFCRGGFGIRYLDDFVKRLKM